MKIDTTRQVRYYIGLLAVFFIFSTAVSMYLNIRKNHEFSEQLAVDKGQSFFKVILAMRNWNANHGGVYVPVTENMLPNPYLDDPLRDITSSKGLKLTKINPAYMTRLISESFKKDSLYVHMTSLNLLNPSNKPDEWEKKALERFAKGEREIFTGLREKEQTLFRYIAPLTVEKDCLQCHAKQGYKIGDIRGGISISFSLDPFRQATDDSNEKIIISHFLFSLLGLSVILFMGKRLITSVNELQTSRDRIKKLEGILPICSYCKKIRDDKGAWKQIEVYISDRSEAAFSHGYCPDCAKKAFEEVEEFKKNNQKSSHGEAEQKGRQ